MDFGIAHEMHANAQTTTGGIEGTPAFMAPEQAHGETQNLDARTDVYGLGATLFNTLCGRPPFIGPSADVLISVLKDEPPRLRTFDAGIPYALELIVHKCLEKDPARRYHSAQALADDLGRYLDGARIAARPPGLARRLEKLALRHKLLVASAATAFLASLVLAVVMLRVRWQAAEQARLSEQLGQEIARLEWLLRSARQLPLHDLEQEKGIVRKRMAALQSELNGYGPRTSGLAHYALGRGHMALHEYPQALAQLKQALDLGIAGAEVHYALGFVLGKHYEQAMYEARLAGGGDWAKQQIKEIAPLYLYPAIASLLRSRTMKLDAPEYLEGLIAYYQHDYDTALKDADAALREAPWLYEAPKLSGDVHLGRALDARDAGRNEEAAREFQSAVKSYETAAAMGQSDGEVYQGLAEAWLRRIEMAVSGGQPTESAYAAVIAASDKAIVAEPNSVAGPLKKAFAAMMTMGLTGSGLTSAERINQCLSAAEAVLKKEPDNLYAREASANCYANAAEQARSRGEDPEPLWDKALRVFETALRGAPHFLWGLNDIANIYVARGSYLALHGSPSARSNFEKAIKYYDLATTLDKNYVIGWQNLLGCMDELVLLSQSKKDSREFISISEMAFQKCTSINQSYQPCYGNYIILYARLAKLSIAMGETPEPYLGPAQEKLRSLRLLGGSYLDVEQHTALLHWAAAKDRLRRLGDPGSALAEARDALARCFALSEKDVVCRTLAVQVDLVAADFLALRGKPFLPILKEALTKATLATQSPEQHPDAWLALAETQLRLARVSSEEAAARDLHITEGLAATERIFALNPTHGEGRALQTELQRLLYEPTH